MSKIYGIISMITTIMICGNHGPARKMNSSTLITPVISPYTSIMTRLYITSKRTIADSGIPGAINIEHVTPPIRSKS